MRSTAAHVSALSIALVGAVALPAAAKGATPVLSLNGAAEPEVIKSLRWMNNNTSISNDRRATVHDGAPFASATDAHRPGIHIYDKHTQDPHPWSETMLFTDELKDETFSIDNERYVEYTLTTKADIEPGTAITAVSQKDWSIWAYDKWGTGTSLGTANGTVDNKDLARIFFQGYKATGVISRSDTFDATDYVTLFGDAEFATTNDSPDVFKLLEEASKTSDSDPDWYDVLDRVVTFPSYVLQPSSSYTVRLYPYATEDGSGRAAWDDITIYTSPPTGNYADDYVIGVSDPVGLTAPDMTLTDQEGDTVATAVTFTDPVPGDVLTIDGVIVASVDDAGAITVLEPTGDAAGVGYTVTSDGSIGVISFDEASTDAMVDALTTLSYAVQDDDAFAVPGTSTRTFEFEVSDGEASTTASTVITVHGPNLPPVAEPDSVTTTKDTPVTHAVLGNDEDSDGHLDVASVELLDPATGQWGGTVTLPGEGTYEVHSDGTVTFTPEPGFTGDSTVTYRVADDDGALSNETTFTARVVDALDVVKTSDADGDLAPGDTITYTVEVSNVSDVTQTGVVVEDELPAGTTYVPGSTTAIVAATGASRRRRTTAARPGSLWQLVRVRRSPVARP